MRSISNSSIIDTKLPSDTFQLRHYPEVIRLTTFYQDARVVTSLSIFGIQREVGFDFDVLTLKLLEPISYTSLRRIVTNFMMNRGN